MRERLGFEGQAKEFGHDSLGREPVETDAAVLAPQADWADNGTRIGWT